MDTIISQYCMENKVVAMLTILVCLTIILRLLRKVP